MSQSDLPRPVGMHDREREWVDLTEFATDTRAGATLAFVHGRPCCSPR